ncbi:hypothetical protein IH992_27015 [Candidatus Poribacteria bacterium]|nr:hypothetical protein [Candidatus Poribacteria bacterium]
MNLQYSVGLMMKLPLVEQMSIADEIVKRTKQDSYYLDNVKLESASYLRLS